MNTKKIDIVVYKATKLEMFLSKHLPYWIPFISKRKRIKIKWYYKYRYKQRFCKTMVKTLSSLSSPNWDKEIDPIDWNLEWKVITRERVDSRVCEE